MNSSQKPPIPGKPRLFYGWYIVFALWVMFFLVNAVSTGIFFKPILEAFRVDRATLSLIYTLAMLLMAIVTPFLGRAIDRFGPRVMLFISVGMQALSSTVNGLAASLWHVFAGRFLYEIKAMQPGQVLINRWFVKKRGRAQGIAATGMPLGALIMVPLSQYLILTWGWRQTMLFWAGVSFIIVLPLTLLMRNKPEEKGYGPDGEPVEGDAHGAWSLKSGEDFQADRAAASAGQGLAGAFRQTSFWFLSATQLICGVGCGFMMTQSIIFATDMGFSDMAAASLVSVQGALNLVGVLVMGFASDRMVRKNALSLTHIVRGIAFAMVVVFILSGGARGQPWLLYVAMGLFGFGWFTTAPLAAGLVADLYGNLRMGTILGVTLASHMLGAAVGSYAGGAVFELTGSYLWFFLLQGPLELVAAGLAFFIKQKALY